MCFKKNSKSLIQSQAVVWSVSERVTTCHLCHAVTWTYSLLVVWTLWRFLSLPLFTVVSEIPVPKIVQIQEMGLDNFWRLWTTMHNWRPHDRTMHSTPPSALVYCSSGVNQADGTVGAYWQICWGQFEGLDIRFLVGGAVCTFNIIDPNFALFAAPWCYLNENGDFLEILSKLKGQIFEISHQASWPIFGGPHVARCPVRPTFLVPSTCSTVSVSLWMSSFCSLNYLRYNLSQVSCITRNPLPLFPASALSPPSLSSFPLLFPSLSLCLSWFLTPSPTSP